MAELRTQHNQLGFNEWSRLAVEPNHMPCITDERQLPTGRFPPHGIEREHDGVELLLRADRQIHAF